MGVTGDADEGRIRVMLLRDLERELAEEAPQHLGLLAAVRELLSEAETSADRPRRDPPDVGR